jgi:hypothetical protein
MSNHQQIDRRSLAMDQSTAQRLLANPTLLERAVANLDRWLKTRSHGAPGLALLASLASLAGLLMLTGCIRVEISGFDPFDSSSSAKDERVRLSLSEVGGKIIGDWETSENFFKSPNDGGYYLKQTTRTDRSQGWEIVYGGNAVSFPKVHYGINKPGTAPIQMVFKEDVGTIEWAGQRVGNKGTGRYTFTPNPEFLAAIQPHTVGDLPLQDLEHLAQHKVERAYFIQAASVNGGKVAVGEVMTLVNHGIPLEELKQWAATRSALSIPQVIGLKNNGVPPEALKGFEQAQPGISVDEVIRYRQNGLNPDYVQAWIQAGFALKSEEFIRLRNHGVPIEFGQALRRGGFSGSIEDILGLRNHGVSPDFYAGAMGAMPKLSNSEVVLLRQHGVPVDYLQGWKEIGYEFSAEEIIRLRSHGVPIDYARQANPPGRKLLDPATLIEARNRGLSAEIVRKLRE